MFMDVVGMFCIHIFCVIVHTSDSSLGTTWISQFRGTGSRGADGHRGLRVSVHDGVHEGQDDPSMVRQINCMSELEWITKSDYVSYIMCRTDVIQKIYIKSEINCYITDETVCMWMDILNGW